MKRSLLIPAILILVIALPTWGQMASHSQTSFAIPNTQLQPVGKTVARVNGVELSDVDLVREEYAIFPYARQHGGNIPKDMEPGIRQGALQMIVFEELVYQQAKKDGLAVPAARLTKAQGDFRRTFNSPGEYQQFVKVEFGGKEAAVRERIRRSLLIDQYLRLHVTNRAAIGPVELKAYYDKNPARFSFPESFAIQTISVMPPANASPAQIEEAKKRSQDAIKQAKATKTAEEFGLLAEKISDDDYRVMMGNHKPVARDQMPPEMLQPALKMKAGDVSELLQVGQYYVIFRLNQHIAPGKQKFEDVKTGLQDELQKKKTEQLRTALNRKLRQGASVEIL